MRGFTTVTCPLCGQRKAKRNCPALHTSICTVCCATKRLTEIDCPPDCVHLVSARAHPSASAKRQQEVDVAVLMPSIRELTERQYQLFFLFQNVIAQTQPEGLSRVTDLDVAEAAASLAGTLETAARGIIYEQPPHSPTARRLADGFKTLMEQVRERGATLFDREAAITLRAIEQGARTVAGPESPPGTVYIDLMARILQVNRAKVDAPTKGSSIIVP
jgi:hypothetical protein